jgi:hypothetical protein
MRRFLIVVAIAVLALAGVACGGNAKTASPDTRGEPTQSSAPALATKTVEAGLVTVKIDPVRIDATGAEFKVIFDTHSVDLDLDVARNATLTVADAPWTGATWSGDGPSGHHREGTVRFAAAGPARGAAELSLGGLPGPVTASWTLGA